MSNKRLSQEEFIADCKRKHGGKYDYSLTQYLSKDKRVVIICQYHGEFEQFANNHRLRGMGCPKCSKEASAQRSRQTANQADKQFVGRAHNIHKSKYSYNDFKYVNNKSKGLIACPYHGNFSQTPSNHLKGMGCPACKREADAIRSRQMAKRAANEFINKARAIHHNRYDYSQVCYTDNKTPVTIVCPRHGAFQQKPSNHLTLARGCASCQRSHAEDRIADWLNKHGVSYIQEKRIREFNPRKAFDFYIPAKNLYIEYDGEFHSQPIFGHARLKAQTVRDQNRNQWCAENGVRLVILTPLDLSRLDQSLQFCL